VEAFVELEAEGLVVDLPDHLDDVSAADIPWA
jgi:hypothetical protein